MHIVACADDIGLRKADFRDGAITVAKNYHKASPPAAANGGMALPKTLQNPAKSHINQQLKNWHKGCLAHSVNSILVAEARHYGDGKLTFDRSGTQP
ncbi:hypothetical protein GCM10011297_10910 [Bacterioplanes sanyensis]|uniref:hypothetical protein n=1 Tax=Bacterioplanes sanyensis TaxID=1249553 RepID=UPI0016785509|nr:hypothetical protein [Bacterioplanes sanyensis]GGY39523.1 hypothetical protein GCM10011297_10910 [Bacterioplanes sanyensis]